MAAHSLKISSLRPYASGMAKLIGVMLQLKILKSSERRDDCYASPFTRSLMGHIPSRQPEFQPEAETASTFVYEWSTS
ncbi:uncharacterized protein MONOS_17949 [Monocercomonoides exilis]|uniref:uncharacterized protein n=1 Tax=Monocercomonoides exilis TaxID=2049356 RepID=UPI00355A55BE|nr:hypothetical protein MONOS_17948 [Monocercomonoides exilis]KAH7819025.1 hypothetical protein MONOS_17949 [Monocercomonoides exilis]